MLTLLSHRLTRAQCVALVLALRTREQQARVKYGPRPTQNGKLILGPISLSLCVCVCLHHGVY